MKRSSEHAISVHIDEAAYREAESLARRTYQIFRNTQGHYPNTINSHLRGKIGEMACMQWLINQGVACHAAFKDVAQMECADIIVEGESETRVEVKTWKQKYWDEMGRCVAVQQLKFLQRKANVVMWCITPDDIEVGMRVDIAGWNTIEDISKAPRRMTGPHARLQVDNHQIAPEKLRPLVDFFFLVFTGT